MAKVFPFKGILYNADLLKKELAKLFTPPYDVISPEDQDNFYASHDFNFIRLILGKEFPGDGSYNNKYIRAAACLDGWLRHKILVEDSKPTFYVYEQVFCLARKKYSRIGFIGLLRLEEIGKGKVFPHEKTYPKAKLDRLELMLATSANTESIFSFVSDEEDKLIKVLKTATKRKPALEVKKDTDGVAHRLWRLDKKAEVNKISKLMKDKPVFIADGHHRYESAIRYRNELKIKITKFSEEEAYNHVMMYFTPLENNGLVVLPIHRVVRHLMFFEPERLLNDLAMFYEVEVTKATKRSAKQARQKLLAQLAKKAAAKQNAFLMYTGNYNYYLLTLKDMRPVEEMIEASKPKAWKELDTTVLHYTIFDRILGIGHETEDKVKYVKEVDEAIDLVDQQGYQVAFILNPTRLEDIVTIASKLEKMPHKSTYFYPKLLSGLVLNKIKYGEKIN